MIKALVLLIVCLIFMHLFIQYGLDFQKGLTGPDGEDGILRYSYILLLVLLLGVLLIVYKLLSDSRKSGKLADIGTRLGR